MKIPYFKFEHTQRELELVEEVIKSGWLTTGSKAKLFEEKFASFLNVKHALAVNSCTSALHLALEAIGVGPGDKVIVPSLTFTASAEVIRYMNADPIFLDVDYETLLLTPKLVEEALTKNPDVKAVLVVNFGGQSAELTNRNGSGIWDVCKKFNVRLVQDCAHSFPASDEYGAVGSIGDVSCFSFYANKTITTGEGGMLVTQSAEIARRAKVMRLHGIDRDIWDRFTSDKPSWEYDVVAPGFKYNMPDINAALGVAQLERAESLRQDRQVCAEFYINAFSDFESVDIVKRRVRKDQHAWHIFPLVVRKGFGERNRLIEQLLIDGVGVSVHYKPLHRMTYYKNKYNLAPEIFPNTERYWEGCFSLPIYSGLSNEQLRYIVDCVKRYFE